MNSSDIANIGCCLHFKSHAINFIFISFSGDSKLVKKESETTDKMDTTDSGTKTDATSDKIVVNSTQTAIAAKSIQKK